MKRALVCALLLFVAGCFPVVGGWFRQMRTLRPVDIYGMRSIAAKLRRVADGLEAAADRGEKEGKR